MPFWIKILIEVFPSIIKLIMEILELIKGQPQVAQDAVKQEIRNAIKERRFDKIYALLQRLRD